jgi:tetratricopeptide (TPR) repeat protein
LGPISGSHQGQRPHIIYLRGGLSDEHRAISIRHAEAAMAHGQDDALSLSFAGFVIGMDKHDSAAAFAAFEAALAVSPSSAITYFLGSILLGWGGEAERAIEWGERGLRLSPLDPWRFSAFYAAALGHFHRGHYEEAAAAARKAVQYSRALSDRVRCRRRWLWDHARSHPGPESRLRISRLERIPHFAWAFSRLPTPRRNTQAQQRLNAATLQCRQSPFAAIRNSSRFRVNHFRRLE